MLHWHLKTYILYINLSTSSHHVLQFLKKKPSLLLCFNKCAFTYMCIYLSVGYIAYLIQCGKGLFEF